MKEYGAFISSTIYGKFDHMYLGLRGAWVDPEEGRDFHSSAGGEFCPPNFRSAAVTPSPPPRLSLTYRITIEMIPTYVSENDGGAMETVTISSKFQVVIPKTIRERLRLSRGRKFRPCCMGTASSSSSSSRQNTRADSSRASRRRFPVSPTA
jgi:hypothetical protein